MGLFSNSRFEINLAFGNSKKEERTINNIEKLRNLYESGALSERDYNLKLVDLLFRSGTITEKEYKKRKKQIIKSSNAMDTTGYIITTGNSYTDSTHPPIQSVTPQGGYPIVRRTQKNPWLIFILCMFLGYFGVHKFVEGNIGMGFLYLFTVGLFGFGWIIDCFVCFARALFKRN